MVSPVAIPKVVTRLLKTLSKQGGIKMKHDQSWWKAGPFFLDHSLSPCLRVAKSHFDMQQTSTGCATKQQRWSSEWMRTEAFSPVVMCWALWGLFIQPEQRCNFGSSRPHAKLSYLVVEACDLLLTGSGEQERIHLGLQGVVHLHVYIVARRLLLVVGIHTEKQMEVQTLHHRRGRNNDFE